MARSPMVLASLSAAHEALLPIQRDKWMAIGLSTKPADRQRAERGIRLAYQQAGLAEPSLVVWLSSPMAGAICSALLLSIRWAQVGDQVWAQVGDQVWDQVRDQVWDQVGDQVGDQVWAQVGDQVWDQVWAQVGAQVGDQVGAQVRAQVGDQVGAQVWDQVRDQVWDQVGDQVGAQVRAQVGAQVWDQVGAAGYGSHDAGWIGFYETFRAFGLLEQTQKLDGLIELTQACGWYWPFAGLVILTERPSRLYRDDRGRLHSGDGLAIGYPDGWGIYAWHGVRVAESIILRPESITANDVKAEGNAEIRRVMLERMGEDRFVREGGAELIQRDDVGELYRFDESTLAVKVRNSTLEPDGSRKPYWLYVHPELRPMRRVGEQVELGEPQPLTARAAVASTFGLRAEEYQQVAQS